MLEGVYSVNIETIDWCNRKCEWCPNRDRVTSPDRLMPYGGHNSRNDGL